MGLKTTGISETAVQKMNRLQGVDTAIVDQASSGVVQVVDEGDSIGLLQEAKDTVGFVAGSAAEAGGPRLDTRNMDPFSEVDASEQTRESMLQEDTQAGTMPTIKQNALGNNPFEPYAPLLDEPIRRFRDYEDGGIIRRGKDFAEKVSQGIFPINLSNTGSLSKYAGSNLASGIALELEGKKATLVQAMSRADAIVNSNQASPKSSGGQGVVISVPNNMYANVMNAATEHVLMNSFNGANAEVNPYEEMINESKSILGKNKNAEEEKLRRVTNNTNNAQLGQLIHLSYLRSLKAQYEDKLGTDSAARNQTYKRLNLASPQKLELMEAEVLGAAAKDVWAASNPELIKRQTVSSANGTKKTVVYELQPEGEEVLKKGQDARSKLFPNKVVKPSRTPRGLSDTDLGKNAMRRIAGGDPGQQYGSEIDEAIINLENIGNKTDKRRMKILFSTLIPALIAGENEIGGLNADWTADMYNVGNNKMDKFNASAALEVLKVENRSIKRPRKGSEYNPKQEMKDLRFKIAQEMRALAEFREGVFYLSYAIQGFQGRITPQQTHINPTTSKTARFATTAVLPASVKRGSRQDLNLRQIYSMVLLKDDALPNQREVNLQLNERMLYAKGSRLRALLKMSDAQYEAVAQAMVDKIPLDSPEFPKFDGLQLDPNVDADLIKEISDKLDDGPAFIDTLIDFANYRDHFESNPTKPFESYANAYMDGKTNGPASAGMQTGDTKLAYQTGVLRKKDENLLDDGDIRSELINEALGMLEKNPFGAPIKPEGENFATSLNEVAKALFSNRDLAKLVIMTGGYGKELGGESFDSTFEELIELIREQKNREMREMSGNLDRASNVSEFSGHVDVLYKGLGQAKINRDSIREIYETAVESLTTKLGRESKALMRAAAAEFSTMDSAFSLMLPNGMQTFIGKSVSDGFENQSTYSIDRGNGKREYPDVTHYLNRPSASAERTRGSGDNEQTIPGDWAYGGAPVAPIQAIDASVVTRTLSGKSYNSLKKSSYGYPYIHTIYDAFKVDANGYDVVLREVNTNWMNITMDWNYLDEALTSLNKANAEFEKLSKIKDDSDVLTPSERSYMDWMLTMNVPQQNSRMLTEEERKALAEAKAAGVEPEKNLSNLRNRLGRFNPALKYDEKKPNKYPIVDIETTMKLRMREVGYDVDNPPTQPTFKQLKVFRAVLTKHMNTTARLKKAMAEIKINKSKLKSLMRKESGLMYTDAQGYTFPLQYYTH